MLNKLIKFFKWLWASCSCTCQSECSDHCTKDKCVCGCLKKEQKEHSHSKAIVKENNKSLKEKTTSSDGSSISVKSV